MNVLDGIGNHLIAAGQWWIYGGLVVVIASTAAHKLTGSSLGLLYCALIVVWGRSVYQLDGVVHLGGFRLTQLYFYIFVGILGGVNFKIFMEEFGALRQRQRLRESRAKVNKL